MKKSLFGLILLSSVAFACTDLREAPLSPDGEGAAKLPKTETEVSASVEVLQRLSPLEEDISATANIGKNGGTIELPGAGLKVIFPQNALEPPSKQKYVTITVTALAGSNVAYTFEPHGLVFRLPVEVQQDAKVTSAYKDPAYEGSKGAYFEDLESLVGTSATVSEFRETEFDLGGSKFRWTIEHFSGYLLSMP